MSPVYFVAPGNETDGEPSPGWYFVGDEGVPRGPYMSRDNALGAFGEWNAKRNAGAA